MLLRRYRAIYAIPSGGYTRFRSFYIDGKGDTMNEILDTSAEKYGVSGIDVNKSYLDMMDDDSFDPNFDGSESLNLDDVLDGIWS